MTLRFLRFLLKELCCAYLHGRKGQRRHSIWLKKHSSGESHTFQHLRKHRHSVVHKHTRIFAHPTVRARRVVTTIAAARSLVVSNMRDERIPYPPRCLRSAWWAHSYVFTAVVGGWRFPRRIRMLRCCWRPRSDYKEQREERK